MSTGAPVGAPSASTSLPRIGSGAATAAGANGSPASPPIDLGRLIGETLARLIGEGRAAKSGKGDAAMLRPDEDGRVSFDEFTAAVGALGLSAAEGRRIFEHFDKEKTGFLAFKELHAELTTRVTERSRHLTNKRAAARVAQSPLNTSGPVSLRAPGKPLPSTSSKRLGASSSSSGLLLSQGGIQGGLPLSKSASNLIQAPSWDPVKGTLHVDALKDAPLWRDDAVTMSNGSRSLMRAVASMGQLSRPSSLKQLDERHAKAAAREQARRAKRESKLGAAPTPGSAPATGSAGSLATSGGGSAGALLAPPPLPKDPRTRIRSFDEMISQRAGDIESVVGKIHDEELVAQQLDRPPPRGEGREGLVARGGGAGKDVERTLRQQSRVIEQRNALLAKANDVRAANFGLREIISRLRLERRLHSEAKDAMEARLADLAKLVPALVDQCNLLLFEGEKVQSKVQQAHIDAAAQRSSQEDLLHDKAAEVARTDTEIKRKQEAVYHAKQAAEREQYRAAMQRRVEGEAATSKLGYLQWKAGWWAAEFDRLRDATGLVLDFTRAGELGLDTAPIDAMVERYSEQQADCASLERFLDTSTAEGNELERTLARYRGQRVARTELDAQKDAAPSAEHASSTAHPHHPEVELSELTAKCDALEGRCASCCRARPPCARASPPPPTSPPPSARWWRAEGQVPRRRLAPPRPRRAAPPTAAAAAARTTRRSPWATAPPPRTAAPRTAATPTTRAARHGSSPSPSFRASPTPGGASSPAARRRSSRSRRRWTRRRSSSARRRTSSSCRTTSTASGCSTTR